MILLVDALAASYGGIATYAEHLLAAWARTHPDDELHVLLPSGSDWWPLPTTAIRHDLPVGRTGKLGRAFAVTAALPRLIRETSADAVLATNPATTLRRLPVPLGVVVHDLRHELRPDQFPTVRRLIRVASHRHGYRVADVVLAISQRTASDVVRTCPDVRDRVTVVHLGGDHVATWRRGAPNGGAVASCHHSNKDVGMLLEAWAALRAAAPPLSLLGLSGRRAAPVHQRIAELGLGDRVTVAPFLPDAQFQEVMTGARLVVFVSDFEGFGLPVVEAMQLRVPVVIGPEPACLEVAGGHAVAMAGWDASSLADAVRQALASRPDELETAGVFADRYTWAATVAGVRTALLSPDHATFASPSDAKVARSRISGRARRCRGPDR